MENQITENAVTEEVVDPQQPSEIENTESESSEVAPEAVEETKEVKEEPQSKEENSKYADVRRKAEKDAIDKFISDQYGESHGIHTKEEYDKAIAKQKENELLEKLKDGNSDPLEIYNSLKENDPDYQRLKQKEEEIVINEQLSELVNDLKGLGIDTKIETLEDIAKLENSDDVIRFVEKGMTLSEAYFLANKQAIIQSDRTKIQQQTIEQIQKNGVASPGPLSDSSETPSFFTEEQVNAMSQDEVNKNYDVIIKSMKSW